MNKKSAIILAAILALVFTASIVFTANKELRKVNKTVEVAQTQGYIPVGSVIKESDIKMVPIQQDMSKGLVTDKETVVGKSAAVSLVKGQFIFPGSLEKGAGKKDGFVEVYIPCDMSSSAMALAGEKVDIHVIDKNNREATAAPVLFKNARVLHSLDQQGKEITPGSSELSNMAAPGGSAPSAVGVEVPAEIAEQLVQYASQGAVYLVKSGDQG